MLKPDNDNDPAIVLNLAMKILEKDAYIAYTHWLDNKIKKEPAFLQTSEEIINSRPKDTHTLEKP